MKTILYSLLILLTTVISISLRAQDKPEGRVHGYVFGDYFYKVGGDSNGSGSQYASFKKADQAFQFRRLYLYYDHTFNETFSAQFLLEGNDKVLDGSGRHGIMIKTAYVEWKDFIPLSNLAFGLIPTPTWSWGLSEKIWNYRSVEKTIADFRGLGSGSDIGITLRGKYDAAGTFGYSAMIGNGNGPKPESNKYKKFYLALNAYPLMDFVVEGYVDYEPASDEKNKTTLKSFAAYQASEITVGIEVVQQIQRKAGTNGADKVPFGVGLFTWAPIPGIANLNGFARYDFYNPDVKVSNAGFNENFFVVGLDYTPIKNVHLMPNIWVDAFSDKSSAGVRRDADVVVRMTFFYVYK